VVNPNLESPPVTFLVRAFDILAVALLFTALT
jgi:hypothetical protein